MKDYQAHLEKLRTDAAECALIRDLATDNAKRELFDRLANHLTVLAEHVELAMLERHKALDGKAPSVVTSVWARCSARISAPSDERQVAEGEA